MKLTYRGSNYYPPTLGTGPEIDSVSPGTYRGIASTIQHYRVSLPRKTVNLKYRGAYYHPAIYGPVELNFAPA